MSVLAVKVSHKWHVAVKKVKSQVITMTQGRILHKLRRNCISLPDSCNLREIIKIIKTHNHKILQKLAEITLK